MTLAGGSRNGKSSAFKTSSFFLYHCFNYAIMLQGKHLDS